MSPLPNIRARLSRASRNNVQIQSASETFSRFKWFTLGLVVLFPIYPSLSLIGTDASAHGSDYDDSTIITAYSDDFLLDPNSHLGETGLVRLDDSGYTGTDTDIAAEIPATQSGQVRKSPTILKYTIQAGDTLAKLSDRYDVSIDAIRWANEGDLTTLKPGMIIKIPPVSWVVHKIAKWDTISGISAKYGIDASDILAFNKLSSTSTLRIGMDLVIPWAQKTAPVLKTVTKSPTKITPVPTKTPTKVPTTVDESGIKSQYTVAYTGKSRGFAPGNCTWYVAQNKTVTWRGNANRWMANARAAGVKTGQKPVPGAIVQFSWRGYNRYYGHVGIVADVTDDYIIVKDMNYRGLYEVTIRKVKKDDSTIDGYIYVD